MVGGVLLSQDLNRRQSNDDIVYGSLAALQGVKIVLRETSCHPRMPLYQARSGCCDKPSHGNTITTPAQRPLCETCHRYGTPSLCGKNHRDSALLQEWHQTAEFLASKVTPNRLRLDVVCDVEPGDTRTAELSVGPLRLMPQLKDCHIRLSRTRSPQLQKIAVHAVLHARLRLLLEKQQGQLDQEHGSTGGAYLEDDAPVSAGRHRRPSSSYAALYATTPAPSSSADRFVVYDYLAISPFAVPIPDDGDYLANRFAVSLFLCDIVPAGCHRYLRFLELVFPAYSYRLWPCDSHPAMVDWRRRSAGSSLGSTAPFSPYAL
ncbi:hypothetical protein B0H63DRAFT_518795 [Podospora didyma]|uniref:Uncharacterized protein n=1 Tax=Podospora didyma TaxID=330526 RepID=A0AAE0NXL1_9PEZI|nr:hypothetical protein B0H63DRAFT_518795 [Podospora didyma]